MKFAIFGNTYQAKKSFHAANLFRLLKEREAEICICREFYQFLISEHMEIEADLLFDGDDFTADMVISIGGDGTFLKAARRVGKKGFRFLALTQDVWDSLLTFLPKKWKRHSMKSMPDDTTWKNGVYCNLSATIPIYKHLLMR